ncbi:hypothetical protein HALTITAN_3314 [Vreelandella titanicae BH1]|uniref:Uncharacterized protein n=1 Tax=Vreelandella titanicae BH1 TaxID=1204738 RepID=L9U5C8_9GAMM|nr:hypothetical protein HALTITAN_3314 [Halomonas titanicae BH1]
MIGQTNGRPHYDPRCCSQGCLPSNRGRSHPRHGLVRLDKAYPQRWHYRCPWLVTRCSPLLLT